MSRKITSDAFDFYFGLGPGRSYQTVAEKYGVNKRSITKLAGKERWQERIAELEKKARERSDTKALETLEAMQTKHLKTLQVVLGKALEALRSMPLTTAMEAVRAIEMVIRQEQKLRAPGSDRETLDTEAIIRREYEKMMVEDVSEEAERKRYERNAQAAQ